VTRVNYFSEDGKTPTGAWAHILGSYWSWSVLAIRSDPGVWLAPQNSLSSGPSSILQPGSVWSSVVMTNELSGESLPGSLGSPVLTSFLSDSWFTVAPISRPNPYDRFLIVKSLTLSYLPPRLPKACPLRIASYRYVLPSGTYLDTYRPMIFPPV